MADVDVLILGGGCAGLSLATRLAGLGTASPTTLVVEQRTAYTHDRTWCFWGHGDTSFDALVSHRWRWLELTAGARALSFDCGPLPYQMLAASDFYAAARQVIGDSARVRLSAGIRVAAEPQKTSAGWRVDTDCGPITAASVVDTRPQQTPATGGAALWQSFYGQEVVSDADVFEPGRAVLMAFTATACDHIPFTYLLPTSPRSALIEATVFGAVPLQPVDLAEQLEAAKRRCAGRHTLRVVRSENGVLPMGLIRRPTSLGPGHVRAGVVAGAARPSTGFAFQRIQQWADDCCLSIAKGRGPVGHRKEPLQTRLMDRLFLRVIAAHPRLAPDLFLSIFEKADSAAVIRFLSGHGTFNDHVAIIRALPARRFIRHLLVSATSVSALPQDL